MIKNLRQFFQSRIEPLFKESASSDGPDDALRLSTVALLIEIAQADSIVTAEERQAIAAATQQLFALPSDDIAELIAAAEKEVKDSVDLYQFTRLVDTQFSADQKLKIVELLWTLSFADKDKNKYEEHLIRRIADLLHVPHTDFIYARHQVEAKMGIT